MSERFETYCCGQSMRSLGFVDFLDWNTDSIQRWVCEVCGHGIDLVHFNFDELELHNELDLYGDEQCPAHIHQLKGGDLENGRRIQQQ